MTTGYQGEHPITRLKILSLDGFLDGLQVAGGLGLLVSAGSGAFLILMGRAWFERTNQSHVSYDDMLWWCGMLVVGCLALSYVSMGAEYYRDHRNDLFGGLKQEGREFLAAVRLLGTREAWASWRQSWADLEKEGLGCLLFVVALFGIIGVVVVQVLPEKQPLVSHRLIVGILILMAAAGLWLASRGDRKN